MDAEKGEKGIQNLHIHERHISVIYQSYFTDNLSKQGTANNWLKRTGIEGREE